MLHLVRQHLPEATLIAHIDTRVQGGVQTLHKGTLLCLVMHCLWGDEQHAIRVHLNDGAASLTNGHDELPQNRLASRRHPIGGLEVAKERVAKTQLTVKTIN